MCVVVVAATAVFAPSSARPEVRTPPISFRHACTEGQRVKIAAVGDLLFHNALQIKALAVGGSYRQFWGPVAQVLVEASVVYGNLEGTVAEGVAFRTRLVVDPGRTVRTAVYGVPDQKLNFNYHASLVDDLVASGFKVVSTANNHALDRGGVGVDRTLAALRQKGLGVTGTRASDDLTGEMSAMVRAHGTTVAFLACTAFTNWPDEHGQVLGCYHQRDEVLAAIRKLASNPIVDAVVLTPHWGIEGTHTPEDRQRLLAREAVEAGATVIVGTHPHVLQPWEKITADDGREALVIYSTGNFISGMTALEARHGIIAMISLVKIRGGKMHLAAAQYVQTFVSAAPWYRVAEDRGASATMLPAANRVTARDAGRGSLPCTVPAAFN